MIRVNSFWGLLHQESYNLLSVELIGDNPDFCTSVLKILNLYYNWVCNQNLGISCVEISISGPYFLNLCPILGNSES